MKPKLFKAGKKPRAQLRMPQEAYIQIDQWTDYLGYEQYVWRKKFISWVDRTKDAMRISYAIHFRKYL